MAAGRRERARQAGTIKGAAQAVNKKAMEGSRKRASAGSPLIIKAESWGVIAMGSPTPTASPAAVASGYQ